MSSFAGRVLVYGGKGALGSRTIQKFKKQNWWVGSIDLHSNDEADFNILVQRDDSLADQQNKVLCSVKDALKEQKLDAIICVAGGWIGGNASKDLISNSELMWRQSIWSSLISTEVAAKYLREGGFICLTGAKAALSACPQMIGYGMAKAAVHSLVKSIGKKSGGLPRNSTALAILPVTLDTPMNRQMMPDADTSTWTPLETVTDLFYDWSSGKDRPASGSLMQLVTVDSKTTLEPASQ